MATKTVNFQTITINELRDLLRDQIEVVLLDGSTPVGRLVPMPEAAPVSAAPLSLDDLLTMPVEQRHHAIVEALARAAHEDFELFEANEFLETDEGNPQ